MKIAVAIVAGGASSRFGGTPKGLERVGGRRIIDRVIDAARGVASELLLVANSPDATRWASGVRVVSDVRPERGSVVGLHTALATTQCPTLVIAWDMPFVTPDLLALIGERSVGERFAVIPESASGLEPFCALYTPACLPLIDGALDEHELRATALPSRFPSFTRLSLSEIAAIGDPDQLFFNVNSADDLARAEAMATATRRSRPG